MKVSIKVAKQQGFR